MSSTASSSVAGVSNLDGSRALGVCRRAEPSPGFEYDDLASSLKR